MQETGSHCHARSCRSTTIVVLLLASCSGSPPRADQGAATDLNPSGRPYIGPQGVPSSSPPVDNNLSRLACHPEGPGTVCSRDE